VGGAATLANGGRQTMALRPINDWDIQIKKQFALTERYKLQIAAQAFNLFNRPQLFRVTSTTSSSTTATPPG
jgi:hypothetical protein